MTWPEDAWSSPMMVPSLGRASERSGGLPLSGLERRARASPVVKLQAAFCRFVVGSPLVPAIAVLGAPGRAVGELQVDELVFD